MTSLLSQAKLKFVSSHWNH